MPPKPPTRKIKNFSIEPKLINISLKQGETITKFIKIYNFGTENLSFSVFVRNITKFITLSSTNFTLEPGETKILTIDFRAERYEMPDLYFGGIVITTNENITEEVKVILQINALELLFSIDVNVQEKYKIVKTGENVTADIIITSIKDIYPANLSLYIAIKNLDGDILDSSQEVLTVFDEVKFNRTLHVPKEIELGKYVFYGRIRYNKSVSIDSDIFEVGEKIRIASIIKINLFLLSIFIFLVFIIILFIKYNSLRKRSRLCKLYLLVNELRKLLENNEFEKATQLYIKIKSLYKEPLTREILEDKNKLMEEMKQLVEKLNIKKKSKKK